MKTLSPTATGDSDTMTKEAFAEAILAMKQTLYYISYSLLPNPEDQDDAVQECIRKALQKRATLRQPQYLRTWIVRILLNECYAILRRKKREFPAEDIPAVVPPDAKPEVFDAIVHLAPRHRVPVVLHYIEGYTTREIAQITHVPEGTIKGRLVQARAQLRTLLTDEEVFS